MFRGRAAIRDIDETDAHLLEPQRWLLVDNNNHTGSVISAAWRAAAALLLLRGRMDAAHEVLLGVTPDNVEQAEYAATHPGETDWAKEHPLSHSADILHAALHRLEGSALGEGNHTGFDNSKFWLAGGPKVLEKPAPHPVRTQMAKLALGEAPLCINAGVVSPRNGCGSGHNIIAGGGKTRKVLVPPGEWDGFAFVDICRRRLCGELSRKEEEEVAALQRAELVMLLRSELEDCYSW